jgi:hypothetical protein
MNREEALQWVRGQDDEYVNADDLEKAFFALYERFPNVDENAWSMVCSALGKDLSEDSCFPSN